MFGGLGVCSGCSASVVVSVGFCVRVFVLSRGSCDRVPVGCVGPWCG